MESKNKDVAIKKILALQKEQVLKVLTFMAGMEAQSSIDIQISALESKDQNNLQPTG